MKAFLESKAKMLWLAPLPNADLARVGSLNPWTIKQEQQGLFPVRRVTPQTPIKGSLSCISI